MSRNKNLLQRPASAALLADHHGVARRFAAKQAGSMTWKALPGSATVSFMKLRGCMCRWPIDDPRGFSGVRYCGRPSRPEASYCESHRDIAFAPNRFRGVAPNATALPGKAS